MRRALMAVLAVLAVGALMAGTGCTRVRLQDSPDTRTFRETKTVPLEGAKELRAEIKQGVGEFRLSGESTATTSSAPTFRGDFTFAPESWRPEVSYALSGTRGDLTVRQPDNSQAPTLHDVTYGWTLALPAGVPTELDLTLGVGNSEVDLRGLDVTRLDMLTGVGNTTVDLSGPRTGALTGRIEAGVGQLTVKLPTGVGVRISGSEDGVGDFSADGFIARGSGWENAAYATGTGPKIDIDLQRGVGNVTLLLVP
jgi:hypothetical protein